jgi:hypothetical protein
MLKTFKPTFADGVKQDSFLVSLTNNPSAFDPGSSPFTPWSLGSSTAPDGSIFSAAPTAGFGPVASGPVRFGPPTNLVPTTQTVAVAGNITFVNSYDSTVTSQYQACIVAAESQIENLWSGQNAVTFYVDFNQSNAGATGYALENTPNWQTVSFSTLKSSLQSAATSDVLPSADPSGGKGTWYIPQGYARMLGISGAGTGSSTNPDDTVTLNTAYGWIYGQDVINGLTHELTEGCLGRTGDLGGISQLNDVGDWSTMDFFHYTSSGTYDTSNGSDGQTTYFSSNGGKTTSESAGLSFNNQLVQGGGLNNKGDTDDWAQQQVFGSTGAGELLTLDQTELNVISALGWKTNLPENFMKGAGGWENPANWSNGSMPIEPQDAFIGSNNGTVVNATSDDYVTVNSVGVAPGDSLTIGGDSVFTATNGTTLNPETSGTTVSGSAGTIAILDSASLRIGNAFYNSGALDIGASAAPSGTGFLDLLGGVVTLNGGGVVNLGNFANGSRSLGTIQDGSLVNVNDTIAGIGTIAVTKLDNQSSGKIIANQSGAYDFYINTSTFTNEGELCVGQGATMNLGSFTPESMYNTGEILLGDDGSHTGLTSATLAIGGNYTITGSGGLAMKGAGAEIIGDNDTFTNASAILAVASGQIGDGASHNFTFVNEGSVYANGAGVTLSLDSTTVSDPGGLLEAEAKATLIIEAPTTTGEYYFPRLGTATGGTIEATTGGTVEIESAVTVGSSQKVLGESQASGHIVADVGSTVIVESGGSVAVPIDINGKSGSTPGGVVTLDYGGAITGTVTFDAPGGTLNLDDTLFSASSTVNVSGNAGTVNLLLSKANVTGGGDTITLGGSDSVSLFDTGSNADTVSGSSATVSLSSAQAKVTGSNDTIHLSGASTATQGGASDVYEFQQAIGVATINGWTSNDSMQLSHLDFASFQALLGDASQVGANTVITYDASDQITLAGVSKTGLTASQFSFA